MLKALSSMGWLLFAALSLQPVAAQTLYKSTMPDGKVIYADKPAPGAVKVETSKPDTSKKGVVPSSAREAEVLQQFEKARMEREAAEEKVRSAEQALREAEAARDAGKEPLATERLGTAGGTSRITEAYWDRQRKLEEAVEQARRNVESARAAGGR
jgi:hypothetical protein